MTGKLLLLTGAPESSRLDWTTPGLLLSAFQPSIAQFALLQPRPPHNASPAPAPDVSVLDLAVWRTLPLVRAHIHTGFSQQHDLRLVGAFPSSADFLTTASLSLDANTTTRLGEPPSQDSDSVDVGDDEDEDEDEGEGGGSSRLLAEFYEHSLAVHADAASSQLVPGPHSQHQHHQQQQVPSDASFVSDTHSSHARSSSSDEGDDTTTTTDNNTTTFLEGQDHQLKTPLRPGRAGGRGGAAERLSDLGDIPPAAHLAAIAPQTMTVSLVVGIISIAAPRAVATRYAGRTATLVEVLVGDDTKSGFAVTFWLNQNQNQHQHQPPGGGDDSGGGGGVLAGLRSQDVVLMQNVALNAFRGKVYGASLRRDMTRVHLLYRARVDDGDQGGYYSPADLAKVGKRGRERGPGAEPPGMGHPQLEKTTRVRDWVLKFVGGGDSVGAGAPGQTGKQGKKRKGRAPPPRYWNQPPPLDSQ